LRDPSEYGALFGPCGVHRDEAVFSPDTYWRGPTWPQLNYLCWLAARRADDVALTQQIAGQTIAGALRSGLAEYWNPTLLMDSVPSPSPGPGSRSSWLSPSEGASGRAA
jgi:hypothetical protein